LSVAEAFVVRAERGAALAAAGKQMVPIVVLPAVALAAGSAIVIRPDATVLLALPLAAAASAALFRRPQVVFLLLVLATATIVYAYALPKIGPAYLPDLLELLACTAGLYAVGLRPPEGAFIAVLTLASAGGIVVGIQAAGLHPAVDGSRVMFLYAAFWAALAGFERDRRLMFRALAIVAVGVSLYSLVQFAIGSSHHLFISGRLDNVLRTETGVTRVRAPGLLLVYAAFILTIAYALWGRGQRRMAALALAILFGATIAVSQNRNMLVGSVAGLSVAALLAPNRTRAVALLASLGLVLALALSAAPGSPLARRFLSLHDTSYLQQTTLADRRYENRFARAAIHAHPLFGVGWGADYGARIQTPTGPQVRPYVHDQYFGLWLRTGILGLAAFLALLVCGVIRGMRLARHSWLGPGLIASLIAIATSAIVGVYVLDAGSAVTIVSLLAIGAARDPQREQESDRDV
jgi:O-antigen ligase